MYPKELLDDPDIVAVSGEMGGKGMAEGVTAYRSEADGWRRTAECWPLQWHLIQHHQQ